MLLKKKIINDQNWLLQSQSQFQGEKISEKLKILPPWVKKPKESTTLMLLLIQEWFWHRISSHNKIMFTLD